MDPMQGDMGGGEEMVTITVPKSVADAFMNVAETFMPVIKEAMGVEEEVPEMGTEEPMEENMMKPKMNDKSAEMEALKKRVMAGEQLRG